ncbi:MAG: OmpA family protein [Flavobacterium sp.]
MKYIYFFAIMLLFSGLRAQEKFTVYFDTADDIPNPESAERLEKWITENKDIDLQEIYGYADSVGKPDSNFELSKRRLVYVTEHVISSGIIPKQMKSAAWGEKQSGTGALADDRRVDIFYTKPKPKPAGELEKAVTAAKKGDNLKLPNLNFYGNSGLVLPASEPVLHELLEILQKNPRLVIEIQGHICCRTSDYEDISGIRAKAVYDFLVKNKIDPKRLKYKGFGGTRPLRPMPEMNENERVANRRVEIQIIEN